MMTNRYAQHLSEGDTVQHCGEWLEVAAVRIAAGIVTVAAMCGGHVAFPVGALVRVRVRR